MAKPSTDIATTGSASGVGVFTQAVIAENQGPRAEHAILENMVKEVMHDAFMAEVAYRANIVPNQMKLFKGAKTELTRTYGTGTEPRWDAKFSFNKRARELKPALQAISAELETKLKKNCDDCGVHFFGDWQRPMGLGADQVVMIFKESLEQVVDAFNAVKRAPIADINLAELRAAAKAEVSSGQGRDLGRG
ncbi:MAG: hypothetical protein ACPG80_01465 [Rickettsiales bacterium]